MVKNPAANGGEARDTGLIPESGRSPRGGHGTSFQYSCLENPMNRGTLPAIVHRVAKSQIRLKRVSMHAQNINILFSSLILYFFSYLQQIILLDRQILLGWYTSMSFSSDLLKPVFLKSKFVYSLPWRQWFFLTTITLSMQFYQLRQLFTFLHCANHPKTAVQISSVCTSLCHVRPCSFMDFQSRHSFYANYLIVNHGSSWTPPMTSCGIITLLSFVWILWIIMKVRILISFFHAAQSSVTQYFVLIGNNNWKKIISSSLPFLGVEWWESHWANISCIDYFIIIIIQIWAGGKKVSKKTPKHRNSTKKVRTAWW